MQIKNALVIGLRALAVCLLFTACMAVGVSLSGLTRVASQDHQFQTPSQTPPPAAPAAQASRQIPTGTHPAPGDVFLPLLTFSLCVGIVVSYLILRSNWHGWLLVGAIFAGMYGISTVVTQLESIFFLSSKLSPGMLRAIFLQGAIATALFAPLAVFLLGKWQAAVPEVIVSAPTPIRAASAAWKLALLVVAFVFLYMFFGYYVAWQNPELRAFYAGPDWPNFSAAMKGNWQNSRWIFALASFRALLYIAFVYPLIRMLRASRWESAIVTALFLASWNHRAAFVQPPDARQRGSQPLLGNPRVQFGLWHSTRLVAECSANGRHA